MMYKNSRQEFPWISDPQPCPSLCGAGLIGMPHQPSLCSAGQALYQMTYSPRGLLQFLDYELLFLPMYKLLPIWILKVE